MSVSTFSSLAQRIANCWAETIPDFILVSSIPVPEASPQQFHAFLRGVAGTVRARPDWLDLPMQPDDGYEHGELQNHRPELIRAMLNTKRKLDDFITLLLRMGLYGTVDGRTLHVRKEDMNLTTKTVTRLARFGLTLKAGKTETAVTCDAFPDLFPAWVWMAAEATRTAPTTGKKGVPPVRFSHCLYSDTYPYSKDVLIRLACDSPGLPVLIGFLEKEGYALVCNRANKVAADWVKSYGKADGPLKDAWAERTHGGLAIEYDWIQKNPLHFALRIPEFKTLLQHFDVMPDQTKEFVIQHTKHCDNCGYCTQTDKTGKRPRAFISVEHNGRHNLCLMFPGFGYTWQQLDDAAAADIQTFLTFVNDTLSGNESQK
ncbi:MAG: hypothetical protein JW934_10230 [Anaerolineae bacterium]|nr:hypothetical protein [Anaerolineae bacterium]